MALSTQVEDSLKDAEDCLRNALAFAARSERAFVAREIAQMVSSINNLMDADQIIDHMDQFIKAREEDDV